MDQWTYTSQKRALTRERKRLREQGQWQSNDGDLLEQAATSSVDARLMSAPAKPKVAATVARVPILVPLMVEEPVSNFSMVPPGLLEPLRLRHVPRPPPPPPPPLEAVGPPPPGFQSWAQAVPIAGASSPFRQGPACGNAALADHGEDTA